jgi:hypothetical protein
MTTARTNKPTTVPGIPKPPAEVSPTLRRYLESLSEAVEIRLGRRGDPRDRAITLRELIDSGLAVELGANPFQVGPAPPPPPPPPPLNAAPTAPINFTATGGYSLITCFWDYPDYGPHSHTEIWRHDQNILGDAQLVGISSGISFVDPVGEGASYYYWARHVSLYDIQGPFNAIDGTLAETALNVVELLNVLTGAITESQLFAALGARINLIDDPTTGLVKKVEDLEIVYGDTVSAAASAAAAATSASAAVSAQTAALLAQTGAETARDEAVVAKTSAESSQANASTFATQASESATGAAGSAASASQSATTAANSATTAGDSASAAATSASNADSYATDAETASTAANTAKVAAEAARDSASESASAAVTSASTATAKATEASQSATSASTSATIATSKAAEAATSATNASTSETNAEGSASTAAISASAAANSANDAGGSASAAANSASVASTKADEASNSASAASVAKVAAESARDTADSHASAAATSASTASTKADEAESNANAASTSATQAATSASNALTYRNDAASSASTATTKAAQASTSAGAAATSENNAGNSANAASISANTASTKATEASQSANAANSSASNASTSAGDALAYRNDAAASASNASGSASSAATSLSQVQATIRGTSLGLPIEQWALNGQSLVTLNDGVAGKTALRLSGIPGAYPNQGNFIPINSGKKYRVKFWARPSSNATGRLYFSLRQFTNDNASSPGPVNGGRSPYQPGAVTRAAHLSPPPGGNPTLLPGTEWGEYSYEWTPQNWQSGVKFFQPEFLDNYNGGQGYWDIQGFTLFDITDVDEVSVALQTLATVTAGPEGTQAQYTVKIDNNGYVSGFGLSSTYNNSTPFSEFIVRADRFSIAAVGQSAIVPFIVQTSAATINGVSVPAGVYMNDAYIRNGTITSAKIGEAAIDDAKIASLSADKITAGTIDTARLAIDNVTLDSYYDPSIQRNRLRIRDLGVDTAQIGNAAITSAKIGNAEVGTLKIAGNAITQPETYGAADVYVTSAITASTGGYTFVGQGNGDYIYEPELGGYFFVGAGNGDYAITSGGTLSGGHVAIETPQINVGVDSTAALQAVFYAFCDGSLVNDGGQILYMQVDKYANGAWSGYQTVATSRVGARTSGGNTQSVFSIAMAHTAVNLQNIRIKVLVGSQAVQATLGSPSNPTYLRNISISVLGAKR